MSIALKNHGLIAHSASLPFQNPNEYVTAPDDAMQYDLVPELSPSVGYEKIATAMDLFSRSLFAYPTSNQDAKTIAKVIFKIMTNHAYLPTTIISDKGSAFVSDVIKEVAVVLGITLNQATTKHPQTVGLIEQSHASIREALKIETLKRRSLWREYASITVLNYTSYHSSIDREPRRVFHGRVPYNVHDLKKSIRQHKKPTANSQIAQDVLEQTERSFKDDRENAMQAYINYQAFYHKKPMPKNSNKLNTFTSYSQKRITKEAKYLLQFFVGLEFILLKKFHQKLGTLNWDQ